MGAGESDDDDDDDEMVVEDKVEEAAFDLKRAQIASLIFCLQREKIKTTHREFILPFALLHLAILESFSERCLPCRGSVCCVAATYKKVGGGEEEQLDSTSSLAPTN